IPIDLERSATLPTALAGPFDPGLHSISISWHPRPAPLLSSTGNPKKNIVILHSLSLPHQGAKMVPKGVAPSSRGRAHDLVREELLRPVAGLIDEVPETREVPEAGGVDRHAGQLHHPDGWMRCLCLGGRQDLPAPEPVAQGAIEGAPVA